MSVKQFMPAIKYGNAVTSDEVDLSGATGDVTFTAGDPQAGTQSVTALNPAIGQTRTTSLTATQIQGMYGTPVSVVPAPGAGKIVVVDSYVFSMTPTTTSFTAGGVVRLIYNSSASTTVAGTLTANCVTTGNAGLTNNYFITGVNSSFTAPGVANAAILITNDSAAFATGTGTAKVIVNYQIVTL